MTLTQTDSTLMSLAVCQCQNPIPSQKLPTWRLPVTVRLSVRTAGDSDLETRVGVLVFKLGTAGVTVTDL